LKVRALIASAGLCAATLFATGDATTVASATHANTLATTVASATHADTLTIHPPLPASVAADKAIPIIRTPPPSGPAQTAPAVPPTINPALPASVAADKAIPVISMPVTTGSPNTFCGGAQQENNVVFYDVSIPTPDDMFAWTTPPIPLAHLAANTTPSGIYTKYKYWNLCWNYDAATHSGYVALGNVGQYNGGKNCANLYRGLTVNGDDNIWTALDCAAPMWFFQCTASNEFYLYGDVSGGIYYLGTQDGYYDAEGGVTGVKGVDTMYDPGFLFCS
jgi:hypothetical protein